MKIEKVHHAHLYSKKDEIELRFFYEDSSYFGEKLGEWLRENKNIGTFMKVNLTPNERNDSLQKIDLSDSKWLSFSVSTGYYEDVNKYVIIKIDTVKFYWEPNPARKNSAEFYLDDKGFNVVNSFYGYLSPKEYSGYNEDFMINRINDSKNFYKLGQSLFRPEFYFRLEDSERGRTATITKEPKIQFEYPEGITEEKSILYGEVVLLVASFYHHMQIDFRFRRMFLPDSTITIKNIEKKNYTERNRNLSSFGINGRFKDFLNKSWQEETLKNFHLLSKAVTLFNQSLLVDNSSAFLIRYNIIEICDKQQFKNEHFTTILNKEQKKEKRNKALEILLEMIDPKEHALFKDHWQNSQKNLGYKPMKNQLVAFLESQKLNPKNFSVSINDLKKLRDNVTHGRIDKIDKEQLKDANALLYRINGILILNLMGINDWKFENAH
ncbi:hypothetical protein [Flavobacterium sp. GNP002]